MYPPATSPRRSLGYAGTDNHGLAGLELGLEGVLAGHDRERDGRPRPVGPGDRRPQVDVCPRGKDVTLTLDHTIQAKAEAVLRETIDQWHAKAATAIVLDPRTGGILAMAIERGFDANRSRSCPRTSSATGPSRTRTSRARPSRS